jgi:hypothetical protein
MTILSTVISAISALAGGFAGGWVVAYRLGAWRQKVDSDLATMRERLAHGGRAVDTIPVITTRVDLILEELRTIRREMGQDRKHFVTHEECNRRHGNVTARNH